MLCSLQQDLELQQHNLELLQNRMHGSESHQLAEALTATEAQLAAAQEEAAAAAQKKREMVELAKVDLLMAWSLHQPTSLLLVIVNH